MVVPSAFKLANAIPMHKKTQKTWSAIAERSVFFLSQRYMKSSCLSKYQNTLNHFYSNILVDSEMDSIPSNVFYLWFSQPRSWFYKWTVPSVLDDFFPCNCIIPVKWAKTNVYVSFKKSFMFDVERTSFSMKKLGCNSKQKKI